MNPIGSDSIGLAIITTRRDPDYLERTLESFSRCGVPARRFGSRELIVSPEETADRKTMAAKYGWKLSRLSTKEQKAFDRLSPKQQVCHAFVRALLVATGTHAGVCICEDDVLFRAGFASKLTETLKEIQRSGVAEFALSGYSPYELSAYPGLRRGRLHSEYPAAWFYGTQCFFITSKLARSLARFVRERGVPADGMDADLLVNNFFLGNGKLFGTKRSLVQHIGKLSARKRIFHQSPSFEKPWPGDEEKSVFGGYALTARKFLKSVPGYPRNRFAGRGIVICAGGKRYFTCAWVCLKMLRRLGCTLPVELWHLGPDEMTGKMKQLAESLGVRCVDAHEVSLRHPVRRLGGWELKCYAILHSRFREALLLDADNVPVANPEFLFDTPQFKQTGAIFWPDLNRLDAASDIWKICGVKWRDEPEFESGQIAVDKKRCWRALQLAMHYNEHSDFYYQYIYGDKETFHLAFRKLGQPWSMPPRLLHSADGMICQHDFDGKLLFQHRIKKWDLENNEPVPNFLHEEECRDYIDELRRLWNSELPLTEHNNGNGHREAQIIPHSLRAKSEHKPPGNRIVFRGPVNAFTGYGLHACQIVTDLEKLGCDFKIRPTEILETFTKIPSRIKRKFVFEEQSDEWELLLNPPNIRVTPGKRTVYFTMWEACRLPQEWVGFLNEAECVVLPCQWNAACFSASGVDVPIKVIPLGIKTGVFRFSPMEMDGPCVFGAAARMSGGGTRKGLNEVVALFQKAFPSQTDVRLRVKGFPDCGLMPVDDPRVEVTASFFPEKQMAQWYAGLTCFVSMSRSEGWGLMPHQAMAVGRPCITTKFGGHAEYFGEESGYCADYKLVPTQYNYAGGGVWAEPDADHVVELMRRVYADREEAKRLGEKASAVASRFTWEQSNRELLRVLKEVGMVGETAPAIRRKIETENFHASSRQNDHAHRLQPA